MAISYQINQANDKKWERIGILAVVIGAVALLAVFSLVVNYAKKNTTEVPENIKVMEML